MGDFTSMVEGLPEYGALTRREFYADELGHELVVCTPLDGAPVVYRSALNITTQRGPMRIDFVVVGAVSLEDARVRWRAAAQNALREVGAQIKAQQNRIVLPQESGNRGMLLPQ